MSGDITQCFPYCINNVKAKTFSTADVVNFSKLSCKDAKAQLKLPEKSVAAPAPKPGSADDRKFSPYLYIGHTCTSGGPPAPPGGMPGPNYDCPGFTPTVCCSNQAVASYGSQGVCTMMPLCRRF